MKRTPRPPVTLAARQMRERLEVRFLMKNLATFSRVAIPLRTESGGDIYHRAVRNIFNFDAA